MSPTLQSETRPAASAKPDAAVPFKDSIWRPILSCGGAIAVGVALAPLVLKPPQHQEEPDPVKRISLTGSQIAVAQATANTDFKLLEGRLTVLADRVAASPVAGLVAKHLAEPGDRVKRGQPVMEISIGQLVRTAPAAERRQTAAEQAQVKAVNDQEKLASNIAATRRQLVAAEARVVRAEKRVEAAKEMVRKLQAGEVEIEKPEPPQPKPKPVADPAVLAAAQRAQREVEQAEKALAAAQTKIRQTEQAAKTATDLLKRVSANIEKVEDLFEKNAASGADVEAARAAAVEAQDKATAANNAAFAARQEVQKLEANLPKLRSAAEKASAKASEELKTVEVFEESTPATPESTGGISAAKAIREVKAALAESQAASKIADDLHDKIDKYDRRVTSSQSQVAAASQQLQNAQQDVMDSVPRARFVSVPAPVDGVVAWVSPLARDVAPGHAVFGLSRGQMTAVFEDKSGLWRKLQVGGSLPALIPPADETPGVVAGSPPTSAVTPEPAPEGAIATITVTAINTPDTPTEPAKVRATVKVLSEGNPPIVARPGMKLMASLSENKGQTLQIPASAILVQEWQRYVAVLQNSDPSDPASREFEVIWKPVKIAANKDGRAVISEGLLPGDRVVRTPEVLPKPGESKEDMFAVVES